MVYYERIGAVVRKGSPEAAKPILSPQQIEKLRNVGEVILATAAVAGLATIALTLPNALGALELFNKKHYPNRKFAKKENDRKITETYYYLKRSGYIRLKRTKGDFKIFFTRLGLRRLRKLDFDTLQIKRIEKWDGKWWQVAADIPTKKYKRGADLLRQKLKDLGMFTLQRTLWFYPFDPVSEVEFIAHHYGIGRFVTVMEVSRLDKDDERRMRIFFRHKGILW